MPQSLFTSYIFQAQRQIMATDHYIFLTLHTQLCWMPTKVRTLVAFQASNQQVCVKSNVRSQLFLTQSLLFKRDCHKKTVLKCVHNKKCGLCDVCMKKICHSTISKYTFPKVENILKGSLDSIPSPLPSVKIQILGRKVCLRCKTLLGVVNEFLKTKSLLTSPSNVLPYYLK